MKYTKVDNMQMSDHFVMTWLNMRRRCDLFLQSILKWGLGILSEQGLSYRGDVELEKRHPFKDNVA